MIQGKAMVGGPEFAAAARWAGAWVPANPDVPIRAGIRIHGGRGTVTVEAYDGAAGCRASVSTAGELSGAAVVSGRLLAALAATLGKADVIIEAGEGGTVRLTQGRSVLTLPTMDEQLWSAGGAGALVPLAEIGGASLAAAVKRVALAAAEDQKQGVIFSCLRLGFTAERLSVMGLTREHFAAVAAPWSFNEELLGPGGDTAPEFVTPLAAMTVRAAEAFADADQVEITCSRSALVLSTAARSITLPLVDAEGKWPVGPVQKAAVLHYDHAATVSRKDLIVPLRQAVIVREKDGGSKAELQPISLTFAEGEIMVGGRGASSTAEAATPVDASGYTGPEVTYRFNPAYLKDALDGSPGDRLRMEFMSQVDHTGVRFTCDEDPSWYHTVAPIRR